MNGIVAQYWSIIPGGIHQVLHETITGVDSFDVFGIEECSSADWNLKDTSAWGESAHYTNGMQWNVTTLFCFYFQLQTVKTSYS